MDNPISGRQQLETSVGYFIVKAESSIAPAASFYFAASRFNVPQYRCTQFLRLLSGQLTGGSRRNPRKVFDLRRRNRMRLFGRFSGRLVSHYRSPCSWLACYLPFL
jgi:hypothetical protein